MSTSINKKFNFALFYQKYGIFCILAILVIVATIINPVFIKGQNISNILQQSVVIVTVACGAQLVMVAGMIDLAPGSVLALSGIISADIMVKTNSVFIAVSVGLIIGLVCGAISGAIVVKFGIPSFIVTLAMQTSARGATLLYCNGQPISYLGDFAYIGQGYVFDIIPFSVILMIIFILVTWFVLNRMKFGRHLYAVGGNITAAKASGVNVNKIQFLAFLYAGLMAGIAGIIITARSNSGQPVAGEGYEFDAVTAVIIGGTSLSGGSGNIPGTIAGAFLVGSLTNIMNIQGVSSYYQQIVQGVIIALAVIVDAKVRVAVER